MPWDDEGIVPYEFYYGSRNDREIATPVLRHWFAMTYVLCRLSGNSVGDLIRPSGTFSSQEKAMGTDCHTSMRTGSQ